MGKSNGFVTRFMQRRPLVLAAALHALGTLIGSVGRVPPALWGVLLCLGGTWFLLKRRFLTLFLLLPLIGAWAAAALTQQPAPPPAPLVTITGRVTDAPRIEETRVITTLDHVYLDGHAVDTKLRLYLYDAPLDALPGDTITAQAETWHPQAQRNPGGFDFAAFLRRSGVRLCATVKGDSITVQPGSPNTPIALLARMRMAIFAQLDRLFPNHAGLARSMLMGDKSMMPEDMLEQFRTAGVAHLLAVSGLHVSCLASAIAWLLNRLGMHRRRAFFVTLPVVMLYALLVGMSASAVRAVLMYAFVGGARLDGRPYDPLTGLSAALMVLLTANPLSIGDPGLILSFSAIAGILLIMPTLRKLLRTDQRKRPVRWLLDALSLSLAAQLGTLPAQCCLYGAITPYALLTNLLAITLSTLALPAMAGSVSVAFLWQGLGAWAAMPGGWCLSALTKLTALVARLPGAVIYAPYWPWYLCAAFAVLCVLCSPYVRVSLTRRALFMPALAGVIALSFVIALAARPLGLTITFLDAGQADAAVVSAEGRLYLADVGNPSSPAADYVRYTGQPIEGVFLTHPHSDHAGGLMDLLRIRTVPVIYVPVSWYAAEPDPGIHEMIDEAVRRGSRIELLRTGDRVTLSEGVVCDVLAPSDGFQSPDGNAASLMMRFSYDDGSALIAGDLTIAAEPMNIPECSLVKASHHGSANATSTFLLRAAAPSVAVISVGRNGYGHPAPALLERLRDAGAHAYRTDESGALTAHIGKDGTIEMETFL